MRPWEHARSAQGCDGILCFDRDRAMWLMAGPCAAGWHCRHGPAGAGRAAAGGSGRRSDAQPNTLPALPHRAEAAGARLPGPRQEAVAAGDGHLAEAAASRAMRHAYTNLWRAAGGTGTKGRPRGTAPRSARVAQLTLRPALPAIATSLIAIKQGAPSCWNER